MHCSVSGRHVVPIGQLVAQVGRQNGTVVPPETNGLHSCSGRGHSLFEAPTHGCTHATPAQQNEPLGHAPVEEHAR